MEYWIPVSSQRFFFFYCCFYCFVLDKGPTQRHWLPCSFPKWRLFSHSMTRRQYLANCWLFTVLVSNIPSPLSQNSEEFYHMATQLYQPNLVNTLSLLSTHPPLLATTTTYEIIHVSVSWGFLFACPRDILNYYYFFLQTLLIYTHR